MILIKSSCFKTINDAIATSTVEKWGSDGQRVEEMLFAWNSFANTQRRFERSSRNDQVEANDQATNSRIEEVSSVASLE